MKKIICFIALLFVGGKYTAAQNINFKNLSIQDGLTHVTVYSIYQDELGNMWFGTRQGLNRYDGNTIEQIHITSKPEDITDHTVRKICGNKEGLIFFMINNRVMQYDLRSGDFQSMTSMFADDYVYHKGQLWLLNSDELVKMNPEDGSIQVVKKFVANYTRSGNVLIGHKDAIWAAMGNGVQKIDIATGRVIHSILEENRITALFSDKDDNIWAGTEKEGIFKIDVDGFVLNHFNITHEEIRCFEEDLQGHLWAGTFSGLLKFNPVTGENVLYQHMDKMPTSLSHSSVYSLFRDAQGSVWAGTYFGGVNHFNPGKPVFQIYRANSYYPGHLSFPIVGNFSQDNKGNLWICTEGGGLNMLDREKNTFRFFKSESDANSIAHDNLKSIWYDSVRNKLYIGTHLGGLSVLDLESFVFRNYKHRPGDPTSLPNNIVDEIIAFRDNLLMLTHAGLAVYDLSSGEFFDFFESYGLSPPGGNRINIFVDSRERVWMTSSNGVFMYDIAVGESHVYRHQATDSTSFPRFRVVDIFEDRQNRVFFSTEGSGIAMYDESSDGFIHFTSQSHGLSNDFCLNLEQAPSGDIIISSYNGLTFFNPDSFSVINYSIHNELPLDGIIEENGLFVASDGEIFVGGINGMISFYEENLKALTSDYHLYLSKLYINNRIVLPEDETDVLDKNLAYTSTIVLNYRQTNINIEFATSNYIQHLERDFEYKLEGFNEHWVTANGFSIPYTNINSGEYTLVVREKPKRNEEVKQTRLHIIVNPPYYASRLAYFLYAVLIVLLISGIILFNRSKALLRASLQVERKEKQQINALNQSKLRFFTNISHEFRTPLTLIINHTDMIQHAKDIPPTVQNHIFKIKKHTSRMRHLINELLDFRKHEQGELKLHVENINLVAFLDDIYSSFKDYAQIKKIRFHFDHSGEEVRVWCDPFQMQKVFFNLLSNAFRYTPPGENVFLSVSQKNQSIVLKVRDTGKGIEKEALSRIFDRFYQVENISSYEELSMTSGIGLALSKSIVELHGGTISVNSSGSEGSTFLVEIPKGDNHFTQEQKQGFFPKERVSSGVLENVGQYETPDSSALDSYSIEDQEGKPLILIVEDNEDLLEMLKKVFDPIYNVRTAQNGEEGFEKALECIPDIVLSDVMMAKMSGTELCQRLKAHHETSHIPVVLLTALNDPFQINQALLIGADDYILKPFDSGNLVVRCNNLVTTRRRLKEKFTGMEVPENMMLATDIKDKELIDKVDKVIEDYLSNSDFNIDVLVKEIGMGRSKLYSRIKEVTGLTPNGYIMDYKMKKASYCLRTDKRLSVSEVAYMLGFSSAKYFSLCFKEHYGITPSKIRNKGEDSDGSES